MFENEEPVTGWAALATAALPAAVTVRDLVDATGLSRRTVRDRLNDWVAEGVLEPPVRGEVRCGGVPWVYEAARVRELAAGLPGAGNHMVGEERVKAGLRSWETRRGRLGGG